MGSGSSKRQNSNELDVAPIAAADAGLETNGPACFTKRNGPNPNGPLGRSRSEPGSSSQLRPASRLSAVRRTSKQIASKIRLTAEELATASRSASVATIRPIDDDGPIKLAEVSQYERQLLMGIWQVTMERSPHVCEQAFCRAFSSCGALRLLLRGGTMGDPEEDEYAIVKRMSRQVDSFLSRVIISLNHRTDEETVAICQQLGARHTAYVQGLDSSFSVSKRRPQFTISEDCWDAVDMGFQQEIKAVFINSENPEETELKMIAWGHFFYAVCKTIQAAYEREFLAQEGDFSSKTAEGSQNGSVRPMSRGQQVTSL